MNKKLRKCLAILAMIPLTAFFLWLVLQLVLQLPALLLFIGIAGVVILSAFLWGINELIK